MDLTSGLKSRFGRRHFRINIWQSVVALLLGMLTRRVGESPATACDGWKKPNAAYRFISNDIISGQEILVGHFVSTASMFLSSAEGIFYVLPDTSDLSDKRGKTNNLEFISKLPNGQHGLSPTLIADSEEFSCTRPWLINTKFRLRLGIAAFKLWARIDLKGCNALKRKVNPTKIPIEVKEGFRWLENI